jgi:hypothetical protein
LAPTHPNNCVHFHHITPGAELEDHQLAHILATWTCVKVGGALVISRRYYMYGQGAIGCTLLPFLTEVNYQCTGAQASVHFLLRCTVAGGPTPWRSLTFTSLCKMSLWLLSSPGRLCRPRLLSVARLCLLLLYPPSSPSNYFSKCVVHVVDTVVI